MATGLQETEGVAHLAATALLPSAPRPVLEIPNAPPLPFSDKRFRLSSRERFSIVELVTNPSVFLE